jgi:hypothetical protein
LIDLSGASTEAFVRKKNNKMATITVSLVSGTNNDLESNIAAFRAAYENHMSEKELEDTTIGTAVNAVFDKFPSAGINLPALSSMVAGNLNSQPENFKSLSKKVADYVRANSQGKKLSDDSFENPNSAFVITKGVGGGVRRREL